MLRRLKANIIPIAAIIFIILAMQFDWVANLLFVVILSLLALFAAFIVYFVITGYKNEKRLMEKISTVEDDLPSLIHSALEKLSTSKPAGYFILKDIQHALSDKTDENNTIPENKIFLPETIKKFPWEGQSLHIEVGKNVNEFKFALKAADDEKSTLGGHRFFTVPVPRIQLKNGKSQNRYDWDWIYKNSEDLRSGFEKHFGEGGRSALRLFDAGESCFTARTGTHPSWVQTQEYQKCDQCKKTMHQIAQLRSDHFLPKTDFTIYLFGCPKHPDKLKSVWQCT